MISNNAIKKDSSISILEEDSDFQDIVRSHDARHHAIFVENQRRKIKTLTTLYITTKDWTLIDSSLFMKNKVSIRESISHQTNSRNAEKYAKTVYCSHFYAAEKVFILTKASVQGIEELLV
jgi:hypothetical protein